MKNNLLFLCFVALLTFSCKSDDTSPNDSERIVGRWVITDQNTETTNNVTTTAGGLTVSQEQVITATANYYDTYIIEFKSDGSYTSTLDSVLLTINTSIDGMVQPPSTYSDIGQHNEAGTYSMTNNVLISNPTAMPVIEHLDPSGAATNLDDDFTITFISDNEIRAVQQGSDITDQNIGGISTHTEIESINTITLFKQ